MDAKSLPPDYIEWAKESLRAAALGEWQELAASQLEELSSLLASKIAQMSPQDLCDATSRQKFLAENRAEVDRTRAAFYRR